MHLNVGVGASRRPEGKRRVESFAGQRKFSLVDIVKRLVKLVQQLNKLMIEIISLVGWVLILTKLLE